MRRPFGRDFYCRPKVDLIARELLGTRLVTKIDGAITSGIIVETEAYSGSRERASHAYKNKLTPRTSIMFDEGGKAYIYLCYGIHRLFNIVSNIPGKPDAILVRAIEPEAGIELMMARRGFKKASKKLGAGPGNVSRSLGIELAHYGTDLTTGNIWIEPAGKQKPGIVAKPRIGVDYAGKDAQILWRFYIRNNQWVSKL